MFIKLNVLLLAGLSQVFTQKCDQTPHQALVTEPSINTIFKMRVENQGAEANGIFKPDQRYAISLYTTNSTHKFRSFMITVEDPKIDGGNYELERDPVDVGTLKTLDSDQRSQYSERCRNSVENVDNSDKERIEIHWLSPKDKPVGIAESVRIRAMIAENSEVWYIYPNLDVTLIMDSSKPIDSPKYDATETCNLCSEARYEVIFKGQWSRLTHPRHFPNKLDNNAYSHMVGASHSYHFHLWQPGEEASEGLRLAAETSNTTSLENLIIEAISSTNEASTRTLIRGRKNAHPNMFKPSHALFRVDRLHHLFSVVIAIRPSPDWFLGAHDFELCSDKGWLDTFEMPLYPWDAGTMDGVSYETETKMSMPKEKVDRVALGSFNKDSPFYQINLNDLKAFGHLYVNLLDVYPLQKADCSIPATGKAENDEEEPENEEVASLEEQQEDEEPLISESREGCDFSKWSSWSPCVPDGLCGSGSQFRTRLRMHWNPRYRSHEDPTSADEEKMCIGDPDKMDSEFKACYVDCY